MVLGDVLAASIHHRDAGRLRRLRRAQPFARDYPTLLALRTLQGLAGGALPPMLMTVALRFLPANIKLYGLGGYA